VAWGLMDSQTSTEANFKMEVELTREIKSFNSPPYAIGAEEKFP